MYGACITGDTMQIFLQVVYLSIFFVNSLCQEYQDYQDNDQISIRLKSTGQILYKRKISPPKEDIPNWTFCDICLENPVNKCYCWPGPGIKKSGVVIMQLYLY